MQTAQMSSPEEPDAAVARHPLRSFRLKRRKHSTSTTRRPRVPVANGTRENCPRRYYERKVNL